MVLHVQGKFVQTRMDVQELFGPIFEGVTPDMPKRLARIDSKVPQLWHAHRLPMCLSVSGQASTSDGSSQHVSLSSGLVSVIAFISCRGVIHSSLLNVL